MQRKRHDTARLCTIIIKLVELIHDRSIDSSHSLHEEKAQIIELDRIWNRQHSRQVERERLIVGSPVEHVEIFELLEYPRGFESLRQPGPHPTLRFLSGRFGNRIGHFLESDALPRADVCVVCLAMRKPMTPWLQLTLNQPISSAIMKGILGLELGAFAISCLLRSNERGKLINSLEVQ